MENEEEKKVMKRRCVNSFSGDVFEECSPMYESGSFWDSCAALCQDSCGCSMCVLAVSCVPGVTDVSASPSSVGVIGEVSLSGSDFEIAVVCTLYKTSSCSG